MAPARAIAASMVGSSWAPKALILAKSEGIKPLTKRVPMMKRHTTVGNRLLAALPPADLGLLAPYLQQISLKQDAVLVRSGDRNEQVYFPHSGTKQPRSSGMREQWEQSGASDPMYGPAVRCKRLWSTLADAVLHQCIRSLIGVCSGSGSYALSWN